MTKQKANVEIQSGNRTRRTPDEVTKPELGNGEVKNGGVLIGCPPVLRAGMEETVALVNPPVTVVVGKCVFTAEPEVVRGGIDGCGFASWPGYGMSPSRT
eukprot:Gregarina_sp_Poly_1__11146@NODE_905_length_5764_cov_9_157627_g645_i0_p7_GENE_NODE_905_length_5764_cov_9_157627_g645_i0NODE_905_length_5764_cov_9_157627_g645_i0_p7_ORF_typecomplete_len100_score9_79ToxREase7/PF15649_6/0_015_NODE_905_length_5764_cov_9_157627_g645_i025562855